MCLLHKVAKRESANKMSSKNLVRIYSSSVQ